MDEIQVTTLTVRRRDGAQVPFDRARIEVALTGAFLRDANGEPRHAGGNELMPAERDKVERFTDQVMHALTRRPDATEYPIHVEDIQDQVELVLMRYGEHEIARDYVLYREAHRQQRLERPRWRGPCSDGVCEACQ